MLEILTLLILIVLLVLVLILLNKTKNTPGTESPRESFESKCKDIYKDCSGGKKCCQGFKCTAISADYSQCQSDPNQSCVAPYTECANAGKPCCGGPNWFCDKKATYSLCKPSGSSPKPPSPPKPAPPAPPKPSPSSQKYYPGDKKATTTWFELEGGDDNGEGACGGCSLEDLYNKMASIKTNGARWSLAATSSSMMNTTERKASCDQNTGNSGTANAPCGSCWELKRDDNGEKLNVIVADLCPNVDNKEWCARSAGEKNQHGSYNHFDIWNADQKHGLWKGEDNPKVSFQNIECPQEIQKLMKNSCCDKWGKKQGCPNICGPGYHL